MAAVICNASPLIILARADLLDLLPQQFSALSVPRAVVEEIVAGPADDPMKMQVHGLPWLQVVTLDPKLSPLAYWQLGRGESEVIEYARLHPPTVALLDGLRARLVALSLGVPVIGTLGLVARASQQAGVSFFDEAVERLRNAGLYLDESLLAVVREALHRRNGTS
ncbi:MAG: DUF3368 domain-containing protein [Planctomycetota bacterium]